MPTETTATTMVKAGRREQIAATAAELFARKGVGKASMADIAAAVDIQKPSLYHFFPSKEALLLHVLRSVVHQPRERLEAIAGSTLSASEKLIDGMAALGDSFHENPEAMQILVRAKLEEHLSRTAYEEIREQKAHYTRVWRRILVEGVESGEFAPMDDQIVAFGLIGALNWMYSWFDPGGRLSGEQVGSMLAHQFLGGLRAGGAGVDQASMGNSTRHKPQPTR